jgi:hypothetical protein
MSRLPNLTLRMETSAAKKKIIKSKQFHSSFQRAPCLTVHLNLPSLALIPHVTLTIDQRQSSGLFGKEYTVYNINTVVKVGPLLQNKRDSESQMDQLVTFVQCRRYSDFVTLHANLQKKFPRNIIPPLPPKVTTTPPSSSSSRPQPSSSSGTSGGEKAQLESRRRCLSLWLQYVLLNGTFQSCDLVKEFVASGGPSSGLWETSGPSPDTILPGDFIDEDEVVSNRHSSVDSSKSGIPPPPSSTIDVINEAAYYKCTQETHTVLR